MPNEAYIIFSAPEFIRLQEAKSEHSFSYVSDERHRRRVDCGASFLNSSRVPCLRDLYGSEITDRTDFVVAPYSDTGRYPHPSRLELGAVRNSEKEVCLVRHP